MHYSIHKSIGMQKLYDSFVDALEKEKKLLAILIDPDKFDVETAAEFLRKLPSKTTHILVGGSSVPDGYTETVVRALKLYTAKPILLFPGDVSQITAAADGILFLSLLSGRNPEFLVGQQIKAVPFLKETQLEIIPTGYLLVDGQNTSAVARVTETNPIAQENLVEIVHTAKAAQWMGKKLVYLEAGSGAKVPVAPEIIAAVKRELSIPIIVGGGIKTEAQLEAAYRAGAQMVVMGTAFE